MRQHVQELLFGPPPQRQRKAENPACTPAPLAWEATDGIPFNSTVEPEAKPRLKSHQQKILARLQSGPAVTDDLNKICNRFSARLGELRKAGYEISTEKVDGAKGVFRYSLEKAQ